MASIYKTDMPNPDEYKSESPIDSGVAPVDSGIEGVSVFDPWTPINPFANVTDLSAVERAEGKLRAQSGAWEAAQFLESPLHSLARDHRLSEIAGDPNWNPTPEDIERATDGLDDHAKEKALDYLLEANSLDDFNLRAVWLQEDYQTEKQLAAHGGAGTLARVGAVLADPTNVALMLSGFGTEVALAKLGIGATRLARIAISGGVAATENALIEAQIARSSGLRDGRDVAYAAGFGFALGSLGGSLTRRLPQDGLDDAATRLARQNAAKMDAERLIEAGMDPKRANELAGVLPAQARANQRVVEDVLSHQNELDEAAFGSRSVGAAEQADAPTSRELFGHKALEGRVDNEEILETPLPRGTKHDASGAPTTKSRYRWDIGGRLRRSLNPYTRWLGHRLVVDGAGDGGKTVDNFTAEEFARSLQQQGENIFRRGTIAAVKSWRRRNGHTGPLGFMAERTYFEEVTQHVRAGSTPLDPDIAKGVAAFKESIRHVAEEAKRLEVKGFAKINIDENYAPRVFQWQRVRELVDSVGDKNIEKLVAKAIRAKSGVEMSKKLADKIARQYVRSLRHKGAQVPLNIDRVFAQTDLDELKHVLKTELDFDDNLIEEVAGFVAKAPKDDAGNIARGKARLQLDETVSVRVKDANGFERDISMADMLENDASALMSRYAHQVSGAVGLARAGFRSVADFDKFIADAYKYAVDVLKMEPKVARREMEMLAYARDSILGRAVEDDPGSVLSTASRVMRDFNFVRVMNQVGIAQLADISNIVGIGGFRAMITHVPEMAAMLKRIKTGQLTDELAEELEVFIASGTDLLRGQTYNRITDLASGMADETAGVTGAAKVFHDIGQKGRQAVTKMSLMGPINVVMQRMTMKIVAQRFLNGALKKGGWSVARLRSMGLDDAMAGRISKMLKENVDTTDGVFVAKKLKRLNLENWKDLDARDAFTMAVWRQTRRIVQENDIGTQAMLMGKSPVAKMLLQFRSFMLTAWTKQFLHNIQFADAGMAIAWPLGVMIGALTYTGQQSLNSIGRADREKYLARMLTPQKIIESGIMRTAWASILPAIVANATASFLPKEAAMFQQGRTTGLSSSGLLSNPTFDLFDSFVRGAGGVTKSALSSSRQVSQSDMRALLSTLVFQNAWGIRQLNNLLISQFPEDRNQ